MEMKCVSKIVALLFVVMALVPCCAYGWNGKGHAVIGHIADCNLTPKARQMCQKYLGGTLSSHASWMDKVRYTDAYHHTARWHSVGVKDGEFIPSDLTGSKARYETPRQDDDHGVAKVMQLQRQLRNYRKLSDSTVMVGLKLIIHMVGDLHCPGHTFFSDQSQQYYIKVGGKRTHYHSNMDRSFQNFNKGVTTSEFYANYCHLSKAEIKSLCKGDIAKWVWDNEAVFRECYKLLPPDKEYNDLSDEQRKRLKEITDKLHCDAGYRLAHIVNKIFR